MVRMQGGGWFLLLLLFLIRPKFGAKFERFILVINAFSYQSSCYPSFLTLGSLSCEQVSPIVFQRLQFSEGGKLCCQESLLHVGVCVGGERTEFSIRDQPEIVP